MFHHSNLSRWEMERSDSVQRRQLWNVLGKRLPQNEVVYFTQVILIFTVIITCIVNLSRGEGDSNLWTCLMSSCLGYLLPNPKINSLEKKSTSTPPRDVESHVPNPPQQ